MAEELANYIAACDVNIAKYKKIEDKEERERALEAAYGMKADFEALLNNLKLSELA
jgi:hypothetical protein